MEDYWNWKKQKIKDDQNGRRQKLKMTKMEYDQRGRQPTWKTTKIEDNQNERQPKMEDNQSWRWPQTHATQVLHRAIILFSYQVYFWRYQKK